MAKAGARKDKQYKTRKRKFEARRGLRKNFR